MANGKSGGAVVVLLLVLLLGGAIALIFLHHRPSYLQPMPQSDVISKAINIDVYIDGSGSMKNFLKTTRGDSEQNYLRTFLSNCDEALKEAPAVNGWSPKTVHYWKFGSADGPKELVGQDKGGDDVHDAALHPETFFTESNTFIEKAVQHTEPHASSTAELKILVTDLYQSDEKMEHIAEDLTSRFLVNPNGAVAIYGIRNPYDGPVEDVPGLGKRSLPEAASSMPFYIIVAGDNAADVRHLQDVFEHAAGLGSALAAAAADGRLFASYFSKDPGRFVDAPPDVNAFVAEDGEGTVRRKTATYKAEPDYERSRIEMIHLRGGRFRVTWKDPVRVTDFGLPEEVATQDPQVRTTAWIAPEEKKQPAKAGAPTPGASSTAPSKSGSAPSSAPASAQPATAPASDTATNSSPEGKKNTKDTKALKAISFCHKNEPGLCVVIDGNHGLQAHKIYLFQFDQVADSHKGLNNAFDEDQPLMRKWNLDARETDQLIRDQKFQANPELRGGDRPGKTPSLSQLLKGLQGSVFQIGNDEANPVRIATYYLYVEVR